MLDTIRRYWIGLLVLVLVSLHASIVGIIRYQASMAKVDASCEVDLGEYVAYRPGAKQPMTMHLYAIVPLNHRMKSRQLIELNQAQVRQALEEYLRQLDSQLLRDPYVSDMKSQLLEILVQTLGSSSIEDLVVTNIQESRVHGNLEFLTGIQPTAPRKMVATLRPQSADPTEEVIPENVATEDEEADEEHSDEPNAATAESGHGKSDSKPAGHEPAKSSHAAPKATSHGAPKASHQAPKPTSHGPKPTAKKSGH